MEKKTITTVDEYIAQFTEEQQSRLNELRRQIKETAPKAEEKISWGMATYVYHGNLVHFAMHKSHIGLYPGVLAIEAFADKLADYKTSKGAIRFPMSKPLPVDLIREIVQFQVKAAEEK